MPHNIEIRDPQPLQVPDIDIRRDHLPGHSAKRAANLHLRSGLGPDGLMAVAGEEARVVAAVDQDSATQRAEAAGLVMDAFAAGKLIGLLSAADPALDEAGAYAIAGEIHARRIARGEHPVGRKIGWTNRTIWPQFNVSAPIWAYVYDSTLRYASGEEALIAVGEFVQPHVEPEIQLHFARTPPVTRDEEAILECIDWIALGFEIVQCPFPDWRFETVDTIAAFGLHGALVIGPPVAVTDIVECAQKLRAFTMTLAKNEQEPVSGGGANVLDSPLLAFAHLAEVLASQPHAAHVQAGEIVTTGTLTVPLPAAPGDTFRVAPTGIGLPCLTLAVT